MARFTLLRVVVIVALAKAYIVLLLYIVFLRVDFNSDYAAFLYRSEDVSHKDRLEDIEGSFLQRLTPLDGQYYLDIAARGHRKFDGARPRMPAGNFAFFPLLPCLLRALGFPHREGAIACALAIEFVLGTLAVVGFWFLARRVRAPPWLAVGLLLAYPFAAYQGLLYTESVFLFLVIVVALTSEAEGRWTPILAGYLAGLCRPQGILVSLFALGKLMSPGGRSRWRWTLAAALAPAAGLATFASLLWFTVGDPLAFIKVQSSWGREFAPLRSIGEAFGLIEYNGPPLDRLGFFLGVGLLPLLWRLLPTPLALYGTGSVILPLATGTILSFGRFLSLSFPHFLCLAILLRKRDAASLVLLALFLALQALLASGLMAWHFVG